MIFDTDVLIWAQKKDDGALDLLVDAEEPSISIVTYMELIQCSTKPSQIKTLKDFLSDFIISVIPLSDKIGHRALGYIEEYSAATGLRALDALIAATAVENNSALVSGNHKHYRTIKGLSLRTFKPA